MAVASAEIASLVSGIQAGVREVSAPSGDDLPLMIEPYPKR